MKFQKTRPATTYKKRIQKFMEVRLWKSKETRPVPEDESVKISISDEEPSGFSYEKKNVKAEVVSLDLKTLV